MELQDCIVDINAEGNNIGGFQHIMKSTYKYIYDSLGI